MSFEAAREYFEKIIGHPLELSKPEPVSGWDLVVTLWPLNEIFQPVIHRVRTVKYRDRHEAPADQAILDFSVDPRAETWAGLPVGTWRVLLERHQQLMVVALANEMAGNTFTYLPSTLPDDARLAGVMLLLLYQMKLPFPVADRSRLELPEGTPDPSMRLQ